MRLLAATQPYSGPAKITIREQVAAMETATGTGEQSACAGTLLSPWLCMMDAPGGKEILRRTEAQLVAALIAWNTFPHAFRVTC